MSDKLTPRSAAQTLQGYQDNHQIELFMQEMLSVVCALLPDDPYEFMTNHVASNRPAPPPPESGQLGSGALWVLLPGGDPQCAEHWRLRRCWLTSRGTLCVSTAPATVQQDGSKLMYRAPDNKAPTSFPVDVGSSYGELSEDEAARPFGFQVKNKGSSLFLAAGSEEQRDEWFNLLGHFSDPDRRKGPPPAVGKILSPRAEGLGGTQVVDEIGPTDIPMPGPKPSHKEADSAGVLKPILKSKPSTTTNAPVPAIRIPRRMPS
ncbi:Ankrd28, partial [Symbiodinium necroappetens]